MPTLRLGPDDVAAAAELLRGGALVALPTETVYGLAARGLDDASVRAIFAAKGRPADNPIILHVADFAAALPLWSPEPIARARAEALAAAFWPGPVTVVSWRSACVPDVVTAGLDKVAVRAPAHPAFRAVLALLDEPLAAPSANASGRPSPTTATDVLASLDGAVAAVLDGGPCAVGIESAVVDVTGARPTLLRPGAVSLAALRAVLPQLEERAGDARAASPGVRHRHYQPAAVSVHLADDVDAAWRTDATLLVRAATAARLGPRAAPVETLPDDPVGYARALYAALYRVERCAPARLIVEAVPPDDAWAAVRDRLRRAAGES